MPSKSLIEKVRDVHELIHDAGVKLIICLSSGKTKADLIELENSTSKMYKYLEKIDMDYELYCILNIAYRSHLRDVKLSGIKIKSLEHLELGK